VARSAIPGVRLPASLMPVAVQEREMGIVSPDNPEPGAGGGAQSGGLSLTWDWAYCADPYKTVRETHGRSASR